MKQIRSSRPSLRNLRDRDSSGRSLRVDRSRWARRRAGVGFHTSKWALQTCGRWSKSTETYGQSEGRLRFITDSLPVLISYLDSEQRYRFNNKACEEWLGFSAQEVQGMSLEEVVGGEAYEEIRDYIARALSGEMVSFEEEIPYQGTGSRFIQATYVPHITDSGDVAGFIALESDITQRSQIEKAIRESEERYRALVELSPQMIAVHRNDRFIYINQAGVKLLGAASASEIIGRSIFDIVPACYADVVKERIRKIREERCPTPYLEQRLLRLDGTMIDVEGAGVPIEYLGKPAVQIIVHDITERKRTEQALMREIEVNSAIAELSRAFLSSSDWSIQEFSESILTHGRSLTISHMGFAGYVHPKTGRLISPNVPDHTWSGYVEEIAAGARTFAGLWHCGLEGRKPIIVNGDWEHSGPHGSRIVSNWLSCPAFFGEELVGQIALADSEREYTAEDLAFVSRLADLYGVAIQRKRAQDVLMERENYYRSLLFNMHEDILVVGEDYRIRDVNKDLLSTLGCKREDAVGRPCYEVLHGYGEPCGRCGELCQLVKVFQTGRPHSSRHERVRPDGSSIWIDILAAPFRDESGRISSVIEAIRDVTAEVRLEKQFRQAQKMEAIGTLAGGISHDFNNILGIIMGYAELALLKSSAESKAAENLKHIIDASRRARDVIGQILTFSRMGEHQKSPLRIGLIVKEALKLMRAALPSTVEIRRCIQIEERDGDTVLADPTQIHQVIMNLCTNAGHAMRDSGGILEVSLSEVDFAPFDTGRPVDLAPGAYIRLSISDTGHGMSPVIQERIFDPYFTTKKPGEGTGLGLAVVLGIVRGHGGAISVYSEPGMGTTFHVYLPKLESKPVEEAKISEELATGREHILIVDDEERLIDTAVQSLELLGYRVTSARNGKEALDLFAKRPDDFDLVMTDQTMPGMTGIELAGHLLRIRPSLPILLCTGFSELITSERAISLGIRGFLMKPLSIAGLSRSIRRTLDER